MADKVADRLIERIFGKKAEENSAKSLTDDEILTKFSEEPDSIPVDDALNAFYRRLRRSL